MLAKAKEFLLDYTIILATLLVEAVVGVVLLVRPGLSSLLFVVLGVLLLLASLRSGLRYFRQDARQASRGGDGALCLAEAVGGVFLIVRCGWLADTVSVMSAVLGACLVAAGMVKAQWAVDSVRLSSGGWPFPAVDSVVTLACGTLVIAAPFNQDALWTFTGVASVVLAVADVAALAAMRLRGSRPHVDAPLPAGSTAPSGEPVARAAGQAGAAADGEVPGTPDGETGSGAAAGGGDGAADEGEDAAGNGAATGTPAARQGQGAR